ncbi:Golgin subfamily A member 4 [Plecturocebus cupreus]
MGESWSYSFVQVGVQWWDHSSPCSLDFPGLAYQMLQREKKKLQGILSQSQDKSLRRIAELRECGVGKLKDRTSLI